MNPNGGLAHSLPWQRNERWCSPVGGWLASHGRRAFCGASPTSRQAPPRPGWTVAAQLGSGLGLDVLFDRQTTESSTELNPDAGVDEITELFLTAMLTPNTTKAEKLQKIGAVALSTATVTEAVRRDV